MPTPDNSVRLQILTNITQTFGTLDEAEWPFVFSSVDLGPLGDADNRKRFSMGIVPSPEKYDDSFPFLERHLRVALEFRVTVNRGDERPGIVFEQLLSMVERVVLTHRNWNGLAIDTKLLNNDVDMVTYGDKTVTGVLFIEVFFRHIRDDTRQ